MEDSCKDHALAGGAPKSLPSFELCTRHCPAGMALAMRRGLGVAGADGCVYDLAQYVVELHGVADIWGAILRDLDGFANSRKRGQQFAGCAILDSGDCAGERHRRREYLLRVGLYSVGAAPYGDLGCRMDGLCRSSYRVARVEHVGSKSISLSRATDAKMGCEVTHTGVALTSIAAVAMRRTETVTGTWSLGRALAVVWACGVIVMAMCANMADGALVEM